MNSREPVLRARPPMAWTWSLHCAYYITRPAARLPLSLCLFLLSAYPNQLLWEGSPGVLRHIDGWDDPVSLLPPQAIRALMLAPREQSVTLLLCWFSRHSLPSFWLFGKRQQGQLVSSSLLKTSYPTAVLSCAQMVMRNCESYCY